MSSNQSNSHNSSGPSGPKGPAATELVDALFGFNQKVVRTTWHTYLYPSRVVRAALEGGKGADLYVSPLRLFIMLFGLQLAMTALLTGSAMPDLTVMGIDPIGEQTRTWLGDDLTFETVNETIRTWSGITAWPTTILASLPYMILLKLYAPRWTFYGHVLVYLVTTNAVLLLQMIIVVLLALVWSIEVAGAIATAVMFLVYAVIVGRVMFSVYSTTVLGGVLKSFGIIVVSPLAILLVGLLQLATFELVLQLAHGLSLFELMMITAESGAST